MIETTEPNPWLTEEELAKKKALARQYEFSRRIGKFWIAEEVLRAASPQLFYFFGQMVVVRAEMHYYRDAIEYVACSWLFDPVPESEEPPTYTFTLSTDGSMSLTKYE